MNELFVSEITSKIWASPENIVLIYAGSAADFALNPENHWLFYTGNLPKSPQMRFITTFAYNQKIFFTPKSEVPNLARRIREIHTKIEEKRTQEENTERHISHQAFKEVGDMLIFYGIKGYEYLNGIQMSEVEKETYYQDMRNFMDMMGIQDLPATYPDWAEFHNGIMVDRLETNEYSNPLYESYRQDLGWWRYPIFINFQGWFVPDEVRLKLKLPKNILFWPIYRGYPIIRNRVLWKVALFLLAKKMTRVALNNFEKVAREAEAA